MSDETNRQGGAFAGLGASSSDDDAPDVMGRLAAMPLTEIIQNMDFAKRTARIDVDDGAVTGVLFVEHGQVIRAETGAGAERLVGEAAVIALCCWSGGAFRLFFRHEPVLPNVERPTMLVLLDAMRVIDEKSARPADPVPGDQAGDAGAAAVVGDEDSHHPDASAGDGGAKGNLQGFGDTDIADALDAALGDALGPSEIVAVEAPTAAVEAPAVVVAVSAVDRPPPLPRRRTKTTISPTSEPVTDDVPPSLPPPLPSSLPSVFEPEAAVAPSLSSPSMIVFEPETAAASPWSPPVPSMIVAEPEADIAPPPPPPLPSMVVSEPVTDVEPPPWLSSPRPKTPQRAPDGHHVDAFSGLAELGPSAQQLAPTAELPHQHEEMAVAVGVADVGPAPMPVRPTPAASVRSPMPEAKHVRWTPRAPVGLAAAFRPVDGPGWFQGTVTDLSIGGAFIITPVALTSGHRLELQIKLPHSEVPIAVMAHIARTMDGGVGVRFMHLTADIAARLATALNQAMVPSVADSGAAIGVATGPASGLPGVTADALADLTLREQSIYDLIALDPLCSDQVLADSCEHLIRRVEGELHVATGRPADQLRMLHTSLVRLRPLWSDPVKRLRYDLRWGHVRAEERIQAARMGSGVGIAVLAEIWTSLHPDRVREAIGLMQQAPPTGPARLAMLSEACILDPFNRALRDERLDLEDATAKGVPSGFTTP